MKKRILALLLVLSMLVSMVPTVFAADAEQSVQETANWEFWNGAYTESSHSTLIDETPAGSGWYRWQTNGFQIGGTSQATLTTKGTISGDFSFQAEVIIPVENGGNPDNGLTIWPQYGISGSSNDQAGVRLFISAEKDLYVGYAGTASHGPYATKLDPVEGSVGPDVEVGTPYKLKIEKSGNTMMIKMWSGETEPAIWNYSFEDATVVGGPTEWKFRMDYWDSLASSHQSLAQALSIQNVKFTAPVSLKATIADSELVAGDSTGITVVPNYDTSIFAATPEVSFDYDTDVIEIDNAGKVTAKAAGTTDITVTYKVGDNSISVVLPDVKVSEPTYVAKIGETKFTSLQSAVNAAQDGDTIVVLENIDLAKTELQVLDGSYDTYFLVEDKTVTVNLNGKTISGAYTGTNTMLVGVFSTDNGGHLTLTGNGTVNVTATNKVYSLIANYEDGCTITIENGTYTLDNAIDSLIYSGGYTDAAVTVKGGTFTLDNVGTGENGKPWIFNVLGAGDHHVFITGGSFNDDINRQHWSNEAVVAKTHYVTKDGNYWTVNEGATAYVTEGMTTGPFYRPKDVGYATFEEAVAAANEKNDRPITLLADVALDGNIVIDNTDSEEQTALVLNGYDFVLTSITATLTAPEGLNITTNVENAEVKYIDGVYTVKYLLPTLNYVSIGDSMANGYCFEGYAQGEEGNINFFAGTGVYGEGAYPLQFEEWLNRQGYTVDHTKLAPSAMRAEDLNYLLGGREMPNDDWYDEVNGYTEVYDNEKLKEFFQTAVTDADIITMGVGNASFGAYMLHRVTDALGVLGGNLSDAEKVTLEQALVGLDEEQKSIVLEVYNTMMAQLKAYVPAELAEQFHVEDICNIVAYTVAGFILNYEGSLEQIVALNPDVEVILVGLMNTTYGMEITGEGVSVPVGDIMDEVFGALNAYIAALPAVKQANGEWADATFYYAEQPNPKFISQEFDTLKNNNWGTVDRLDGQTVRERNISAYNGSLREIISGAFGVSLPRISLDQVEALDNGRWASNDQMAYMSTAIYLGIEDAVAASTETMEIPLESLLTIATDIGSVFEGFTPDLQGDIRAQLGAYLTANDVMKGMCKIYALFKVGNGMSVHPTPAGHDEIADAVIAAYENGYTAEDATKDNIEEYAKKALWLVTEYYDNVYAIVYDKLDEQGYVAASVAALEYVKAQIAAIDVDALELSDAMKAELKEEAALAMEAIEALQNLLLTADELDDETVKAAQALLDDLTDALENMNDILAVAGTDLESAVKHQLSVLDAAVRAQISAAIERAETALENLKKYIDEDIAPAVRAEIEELIETIEGQLEYLQAVVDGTVEATIDQINKALAALEQAVTDLIKTAQNEADQLLQAMLDELKALAEATVAEFEAAIYDATHISMSIYDDQYYVSLGGATAYGAGVGRNDPTYDELVVEALEAEGIDVEFKDLTKADLAYDGLVDYVKANAAEIAKATLITYNMDASGFLMSLFGNDPDWSAYFEEAEVKAAIEEIQAEVLALQSKLAAELDAEALAALAQAEDDVLAALTEQIDPETAKEIAPYAEKLLYAAVSYAVETAKALEAIQTINPEAEIMLVGMYNPLAGTTLTVKGEVINLGEIVEYAMEATDLYHLIYAVANDKVAFVDVSETTVDGLGNLNVDDPKTMINSLAAALMNASAKISANAAGHAYIAEQIIGAIDFVGMLGDINLDGEVDTADAVAAVDAWLGKIELNELQKNNGDVNFDGTVDAADAALIVDFWLGKIQSFEK